MVAAPMTLLMPGAGPPATTMASLLLGRTMLLSPKSVTACEVSQVSRNRAKEELMKGTSQVVKRAPGEPPAVATVALGAMNFGKRTPPAESERIVRRALERGVAVFDTANSYNAGESERILGRALGRDRDACHAVDQGRSRGHPGRPEGLSPEAMRRALEASLERLGDRPRRRLLPARAGPQDAHRANARRSRRARRVGSREGLGSLELRVVAAARDAHDRRARGLAPPVVTQLLYNVLHRQLDIEYFAFARRYPIHTLAYNALAGGLLSGTAHASRLRRRKARASTATRCTSAGYWTREMFVAGRADRRGGAERGPDARRARVRVARLEAGRRLILVGPGRARAPGRRARRRSTSGLRATPARSSTSSREAGWAATRTMSGSGSGAAHVPAEPGVDLSPENGAIDVPGAIAHFREHGWARLGRVASDAELERLRARADDIMHGPRRPRGPLLPARLGDGPLRGARLRPRLGRAEPRVPQDREARAPTRLPRLARERGLRAGRARPSWATPWPSTARRSSPRARAAAPTCRGTRTAAASGASTAIPSCRSGPRSTTRPPNRAASRCSTPATSAASRRPSGGPSRRDRLQERDADARAVRPPRARRRGAPHPQPPLAPLRAEHDGHRAPRLHRLVHQRRHAVHPAPPRAALVRACIRAAPGVREER